MLKPDLILQITSWIDHYLQDKEVIGLMKDEFGEQIMIQIVGLRAKTYSYFTDDSGEDKKAKDTKKRVILRKHKFENCKSYVEATQLQNKINYIEKIKLTLIVLKNL